MGHEMDFAVQRQSPTFVLIRKRLSFSDVPPISAAIGR